jgi:5-methylthioribose kinase
MEHLSDHVLLSKYLTDRIRLPNLIDHVSSFFAQTAFFSSDFFLSPAKKMMFREKFLNSDMCRMTEDLVFTHPFISHRNNKWNTIIDVEVLRIRADKHLKLKIDEIKNEFMRSEQTLIHGDFHTDSMMVTKTDTRVIDPEFAFIGPTAYDLGAMMTNLILYCLSHFAYTNELKKRAEYQQLLLVGLCECWNKFAAKFTELSLSMAKREDVYIGHVDLGHGDQVRGHATEKYLVRVLRDAVGFAGCRILRHLIGIFTFHEILRISDLETRSTVEKALIAVSTRMLKEREFIQTAADLLVIIKEEARDLIAFPL